MKEFFPFVNSSKLLFVISIAPAAFAEPLKQAASSNSVIAFDIFVPTMEQLLFENMATNSDTKILFCISRYYEKFTEDCINFFIVSKD